MYILRSTARILLILLTDTGCPSLKIRGNANLQTRSSHGKREKKKKEKKFPGEKKGKQEKANISPSSAINKPGSPINPFHPNCCSSSSSSVAAISPRRYHRGVFALEIVRELVSRAPIANHPPTPTYPSTHPSYPPPWLASFVRSFVCSLVRSSSPRASGCCDSKQ